MALKGQAKVDYQRVYLRKRRLDPIYKAECNKRARLSARRNGASGCCEVCGYDETVDLHHEGNREEHILCPNHHALITRGVKTLGELLTNDKDVRPSVKTPESKEQKLTGLRAMIANSDAPQLTTSPPIKESSGKVQPNLPVMNQSNYRQFSPGDKVLVKRGKRMVETTIPELDQEGNVIPDY